MKDAPSLSAKPARPADISSLLKDKARTFAFAARFLPAARREAVEVLYAFCRVVDDLVDEPNAGTDRETVRAEISTWRRWLSGDGGTVQGPGPPGLSAALREVVDEYEVPIEYLMALLDGVESDNGPVRIPDFATLRQYCMRVAGTVGLAMCHILGAREPGALVAAAELGIAMQLTNVLRDVGADLRRDRVYLPADELGAFGLSCERLCALAAANGHTDDQLRSLLQYQIARARSYYARGLAGVWLLPPEVRQAILVAGLVYRAILHQIKVNDFDVFRRRAVTSRLTKIRGAMVALLLTRLWGDEAVACPSSSGSDRLSEVFSWLGSS